MFIKITSLTPAIILVQHQVRAQILQQLSCKQIAVPQITKRGAQEATFTGMIPVVISKVLFNTVQMDVREAHVQITAVPQIINRDAQEATFIGMIPAVISKALFNTVQMDVRAIPAKAIVSPT